MKIPENATTPFKENTIIPPTGFVFLTPITIIGVIAGILIAGGILWKRKKLFRKQNN